MHLVPQIRVFLASPGDVNEERAVVLEVLDMLEYDPLFRQTGASGVSIHAVAWDKPGGGTAMRATKTPQTAIKEGLPRPSECDIVLVLFWGRMGTVLPHTEYQKEDGSAYLSGTEWEYHDAVTAERTHSKPITLLYRRTEKPPIDLDNDEAVAQYQAVKGFFKQFRGPSGELLGGVNEYVTPADLKILLLTQLRDELHKYLNANKSTATPTLQPIAPLPLVEAPKLWTKSPFPGLRAFTEEDAPIFFGRGVETAELVRFVESQRFTAVVAASGSGKSSLVSAGLIPRLKKSAAIVSDPTAESRWRVVRFTPGAEREDGPFAALFNGLRTAFPSNTLSPFKFVKDMTTNPSSIVSTLDGLLSDANAPENAEVLVFIDQFEELFTVVTEAERPAFVTMLSAMQAAPRLRTIITMRSDFYANCLELPALGALLKSATYPLMAPNAGALLEMIERPVERAGLTWDEGLPNRIQAETGSGAGALALMAYALDELYNLAKKRGDGRLTVRDYEDDTIGGVAKAIGKRAEATFSALDLPDKEHLLQHVFRELVVVDERGTATRQHAALGTFDAEELALIHAFADARLLVTDEETVEVAHEALFREWERLTNWIVTAQDDLILLRQVKSASAEWQAKRNKEPDKNLDFLRWPAEKLRDVYEMMHRQHKLILSETERDFIEPESTRLLNEINDIRTDHKHRRWIGERLATIGDTRSGLGVDSNGLPQIDWLPVELGGQIEIAGQAFTVRPFYVAKYLTTYAQFQAFLDAPDGFNDARWWQDFPAEYVNQAMNSATAQYDNYPRDSVSWYQSVAFARWLDANYHAHGLFSQFSAGNWEIRLPTEWEWQWMAQHGTEQRAYPWGEWDEHPRANTTEAGIGDRSTAVGMYPHGAATCGALDVAGNLWEWCLNDYQDLAITDGYGSGSTKVLRGGSFLDNRRSAASSSRYNHNPNYRNRYYGFRLAACPIRAR